MNTQTSITLREGNLTIYEALQNIQSGKYTMPAFQRQYVWNLSQIEKLWDSILTGYPIANFLFWRLDQQTVLENACFYDFLSAVVFRAGRHEPAGINYSLTTVDLTKTNVAVLDGQQRLTSLLISLFGDTNIRPRGARTNNNVSAAQLYLNLDLQKSNRDDDDDDETNREYNTKKYDFTFIHSFGEAQNSTHFRVKDLAADPRYRDANLAVRRQAIAEALQNKALPEATKREAGELLERLCAKIFDEPLIRYTELGDANFSDALEMFLRFNNGGRPLKKSDITMSILEAYWPDARKKFGEEGLKGDYDGFSMEFLLRLALMIFGKVDGMIDSQVAHNFKNNWSRVIQTLKNTQQLLAEVKIDIPHFSKSWNVLIPVIYAVYYDTEWASKAEDAKTYLARAALFDYFENGTTGKLHKFQEELGKQPAISVADLKTLVPTNSAAIEKVLEAEKGSAEVASALYYLGLDWLNPKIHNNSGYDQDHMHPETSFKQSSLNGIDPKDWSHWHGLYNKLPNLQLLGKTENRTVKNDMPLQDYYNNKNDQEQDGLRHQGMIPDDVSLELKQFGEFYEKRRELLRERIKALVGFSEQKAA